MTQTIDSSSTPTPARGADAPRPVSAVTTVTTVATVASTPALSVLAATLLWVVAVPLAGADLVVTTGGTQRAVGLGSVVFAAFVGALGALALRWLIARRAARPRRTLLVVGIVLAAGSLAGPLTAAQSASAATVLCSMHLVVAAVALPLAARGLGHR